MRADASEPTDDVPCGSARALLSGIVVVDLSTTPAGLTATQFLADAGAEVIGVEPPGGSPARRSPAWPAWARDRRSVVLDIRRDSERAHLHSLISHADVLMTTFAPSTSISVGLTADALAGLNPRLVSAAITGWGTTGPWSHLKGYEGLVMAKLGMFHAKRRMVTRPGPAFVSPPFASWGAAHTAVHGILSALIERESSGRGQHVEADLARGVAMMDCWGWFTELVGLRWPDAYQVVDAYTENGEPRGALIYPLLVAPTKDGHWLQFAQVEPRLFRSLLEELGIAAMRSDPKWRDIPHLRSQELRTELWKIMIAKVGERTLAEWRHVVETNPNINAEVFRRGPAALDHPQLLHDARVVVGVDPDLGPVRQPSTLVHLDGAPLRPPCRAPRLDEHGPTLRAVRRRSADVSVGAPARGGLPLEGITILEFGLMFAAPFGSSMLADLGARVIKVESLEGDTIRRVLPFPESGGARAMQGKQSIRLDLTTEDGLRIVHELARRCDVVLQAFRAGAAARVGVDADTLRAINPELVYLNAPGYGTGGPCGHLPAYAPSIAAASGLAMVEAPDAAEATDSLDEIMTAAVRLNAAGAVPSLQADGIAALGVASAMLLGLLARKRGRVLGTLTATMLGTASHVLVEHVIDYPGREKAPEVDPEGFGLSALYRMYRAREGWVFLAAPAKRDWDTLVSAIAQDTDLRDDPRFATAAGRVDHDVELAEALVVMFETRTADEWEQRLTAADVGCVRVTERVPERFIQADEALAAEYACTARSPIFDDHLRMGPPVRFSRSATQAKGGCLAGEHTDRILTELGYDDAAISRLRERGVVA